MKTPITYYGGKQKMIKDLLPLIPEHKIYTESFGGGAALLFAKEPVEINVINDLNGELINFYRTAVKDFNKLQAEIETTLHCRGQHEVAWCIYNHPGHFDNVKRAWAVWVLSKLGFSGLFSGAFGVSRTRNEKCTRLLNAKTCFTSDLKSFLERCTIEMDDAISVIRRFDTEQTFHFIDPPYVGSNMGHYKNMFDNSDLSLLLETLKDIKGKFLLTMYPNEEIRRAVGEQNWALHVMERRSTASRTTRPQREEWIICNYMAGLPGGMSLPSVRSEKMSDLPRDKTALNVKMTGC